MKALGRRLLDATDASAQVASGGLSVAVVMLGVNQILTWIR